MNDVVVDSSVVVKWILPEPDSSDAVRVKDEVMAAGGQLIVLDLIWPEVCNAIWKSHRQKKISLAYAQQALAVLKALPIQVEPAAPLLDKGFDIAIKYDRAVYDALFVALAQDL